MSNRTPNAVRRQPRPLDVECSLFNGTRKRVVRAYSETWSDFVSARLPELLARTVPAPLDDSDEAWDAAKTSLPSFILAPVDRVRRTETVGDHTAIVIDVDAVPSRKALLAACERYACAVYESPSSGVRGNGHRLRIVGALAAAVPPELVRAARRAFARDLGLDPATAGVTKADAVSQIMFVGRVDGTPERRLWTFDGDPWVTSTELEPEAAAPAGAVEGEAVEPAFGPEMLPPVPDELIRAIEPKPGKQRHGGRDLMRGWGGMCARKGFHPDAIADAVRSKIPTAQSEKRAAEARECAEQWCSGDTRAAGVNEIVRHFRDELGDDAGERIGRRVVAAIDVALRQPGEPEGWHGPFDAVAAQWWPVTRDYWLKRNEQTHSANDTHPDTDGTDLHIHALTGWPWILQRDSFFWLHEREAPTYRQEVRASELEASVARNMFAVAGEDDRKPAKLRAEWTKPLDRLRSTYTARSHSYDPATNTLTLAALRWTKRAAKHHAHIDRWLRALFGTGYDAAAQWIASLCTLDRPAPCLYLPGPARLGKSLLADGLAALWGRPAPADMAEAISDFNESTGECPLVFTDEGFPEGLSFNAFRKMVTAHSRRVNAKYRAKVDVEGCARFIIAANNEDVLRYQKIGTLTKDDLEAISDRLLVVPCHVEARAEVEHLNTDAAASHEIAEHALWLAKTVALEPTGERMAAKPGGGERILASVVVGRSVEILTAIRNALSVGSMSERCGVRTDKRHAGEVWINVSRLFESLDGRASIASVKECCEAFEIRPGGEQGKTQEGKNVRWRVLSRSKLSEAFQKLD